MTRALSLAIVILEESALIIASILLIGLLAVWIVSDWLWWFYCVTVYRIYVELQARWELRNWGKQ